MDFKNKPQAWDNEGVKPPKELVAGGFTAGYKPPAAYFNYLFNNFYKCIQELQGAFGSIAWGDIRGKPDIVGCMRMYGGTKLDAVGTTNDALAQYKAIIKNTGAEGKIFTVVIPDLPKGAYSIMVRMKVSSIASTENIFRLEAIDGKTEYRMIKPSMFPAAGVYKTLGFLVEHSANSMTVSLSVAKALAGVTVGVDYLLIAPALNSVTSLG